MEIKGQLPINALAARGQGAPATDVPEPTEFSLALADVTNRPGGSAEKEIIPASIQFGGFTYKDSMSGLSVNELVELITNNSPLKQLSGVTNPR
jgi:hypothetical protein